MPESRDLVIRPVGEDERAAWNSLWAGYLTFYKTALPHQVSDLTWQRLHDPAEPIFILGAYAGGSLTGFVHYLFHRSTWAPHWYCYLEDLFVRPALRGHGIGKALLQHLAQLAVARGCGRLEWSVLDWNVDAIGFYTALGARPQDEWTVYRVTGEALARLAGGEA